MNRAQTPEEKAKYEKLLSSAQEYIKQYIEAVLKRIQSSRRPTKLLMTKKETNSLLNEVESLTNEAERQTKKKVIREAKEN